MSNEITTTGQDSANMLAMISKAASDPAVDIEKLERLMAMKERMDDKAAEAEFNAALSRIQSKMGRISADAVNNQTRSAYATYGKLDSALRPIYTSEGMSLSFGTESAGEGNVGMICYVSHQSGHTRIYRAVVPSDGKGAKGNDVMTKTHAFGSGTAYGMRYLLKMIFNVAIGEEDDDGQRAGGGEALSPQDQGWIEKVAKVRDYPAYQAMKAEMVKDYGGKPDNIPKAVRNAFNVAAAETKPKGA